MLSTWPTDPKHALALLSEEFGEFTEYGELTMSSALPIDSGRYLINASRREKRVTFSAFFYRRSGHWTLGGKQIGCYRAIMPPGETQEFRIDSTDFLCVNDIVQ